jgi:hypothetical protein
MAINGRFPYYLEVATIHLDILSKTDPWVNSMLESIVPVLYTLELSLALYQYNAACTAVVACILFVIVGPNPMDVLDQPALTGSLISSEILNNTRNNTHTP